MEIKATPFGTFVPWFKNPNNKTIPKDLTAENAVEFFKGLRIYNMEHKHRGKLRFSFVIQGQTIKIRYRNLGNFVHYFCCFGAISPTGYKSEVRQGGEFSYDEILAIPEQIAKELFNVKFIKDNQFKLF